MGALDWPLQKRNFYGILLIINYLYQLIPGSNGVREAWGFQKCCYDFRRNPDPVEQKSPKKSCTQKVPKIHTRPISENLSMFVLLYYTLLYFNQIKYWRKHKTNLIFLSSLCVTLFLLSVNFLTPGSGSASVSGSGSASVSGSGLDGGWCGRICITTNADPHHSFQLIIICISWSQGTLRECQKCCSEELRISAPGNMTGNITTMPVMTGKDQAM